MEGAMQGAMEEFFYINLFPYDRCSELKFCTKVNDWEIVNQQ
jgi:hypothetical protein